MPTALAGRRLLVDRSAPIDLSPTSLTFSLGVQGGRGNAQRGDGPGSGPAGVRVTIVEPGQYATDFVTAAVVIMPDEVYAPTVGKFLSDVSAMPASAFGDPVKVADAIMSLVTMPEPPLRLVVGDDVIAGIRAALDSWLAEVAKTAPLAS